MKLSEEEIVKLLKIRYKRDLGREPPPPSDGEGDPESAPFSDEALQKAVDHLKKAMKPDAP